MHNFHGHGALAGEPGVNSQNRPDTITVNYRKTSLGRLSFPLIAVPLASVQCL
jgi:hypothetical protein